MFTLESPHMNCRFMPQPWPSRPAGSMRLTVTVRPLHASGAGAVKVVFTASMTSVCVVSWSVHATRPMLSAGPYATPLAWEAAAFTDAAVMAPSVHVVVMAEVTVTVAACALSVTQTGRLAFSRAEEISGRTPGAKRRERPAWPWASASASAPKIPKNPFLFFLLLLLFLLLFFLFLLFFLEGAGAGSEGVRGS